MGLPEETLARMTLQEKAGQMIQAYWAFVQPQDVIDLALGSVLFNEGATPAVWRGLTESFQDAAKTAKVALLLTATDAVHGVGMMPEATIFPHNAGLGQIEDEELIEELAKITSIEMDAVGLNWNLAPCAAVCQNAGWGRSYESLSSDSNRVARRIAALVRGFQSSGRVLACSKHFAGDGACDRQSGSPLWDRGDNTMDEEGFEDQLAAFTSSIPGVGSMMAAFNRVHGVECHGNRHLLTDRLRYDFGFQGFVISDWDGVARVPGADAEERVSLAVNCGVDMIMATGQHPFDAPGTHATLLACVEKGLITMERIDEAVLRILTAKDSIGLLDFTRPRGPDLDVIGQAEHQRVARKAVKASTLVLKSGALPLTSGREVLVVGTCANNSGRQSGGWTYGWQGNDGNVMGGLSMLEAMEQRVSVSQNMATTKAKVALIVTGERPYSEGVGDTDDVNVPAQDLSLIREAKTKGLKVVLLNLAGRCLCMPEDIHESLDGLVYCPLPGPNADPVIDVLFEDLALRVGGAALSKPWLKTPSKQLLSEELERYYDVGYTLTKVPAPRGWVRPLAFVVLGTAVAVFALSKFP